MCSPGAEGIRYCIDAFIPQKEVMGYHGDNRTFSPYNSNGSDYRVRILIANYGNGLTDFPAIGLTIDNKTGESMYGKFDKYDVEIQRDYIDIDIIATNELARKKLGLFGFLVPSVDAHFRITNDDRVSGSHDYFPSYEIWKYTDDYALMLYSYDASNNSPLSLVSWRQVKVSQ